MGVILLVADKRHWRPQLMACLYPCPLSWDSAAPPLSSNPGWPMTCFGQQNADGTVSQFPTSRNIMGFLCSFLEPATIIGTRLVCWRMRDHMEQSWTVSAKAILNQLTPRHVWEPSRISRDAHLPHTDHRYLSEPRGDQKLLSWHVDSQTIKKG